MWRQVSTPNIIGIILLLRALSNFLWAIKAVELYLPRQVPQDSNESSGGSANVYMVLPVLEEGETIQLAIQHLKTNVDWSVVRRIIIVGNVKEQDSRGLNATLGLARETVGEDRRFVILECNESAAIKAHQLNTALEWITTHDSNYEQMYLQIIDIDGRPKRALFQQIAMHISLGHMAIQQHSLFFQNFADLSLFQKCHALYQSRWTLAYEIKNNTIYNTTRFYLSHIVGHGFVGNVALLQKYRGFPTSSTTEDLHLGFYMVASGEKISSLNMLDNVETPTTLIEGMRQQKAWAFGVAGYPGFLRKLRVELPDLYRRNCARSYWIATIGALSFLHWALLFPVFLWCAICAAEGDFLFQLIIGLYVCELYVVAFGLLRAGWIKPMIATLAPLLMILHQPFRSLAAFRVILHVISGAEIRRHKTPHRRYL